MPSRVTVTVGVASELCHGHLLQGNNKSWTPTGPGEQWNDVVWLRYGVGAHVAEQVGEAKPAPS